MQGDAMTVSVCTQNPCIDGDIVLLMDALGSGSLLIGAMAAIIIALAVVGALKGQLKQAAQQSAAGGYVREGSFRLDVNADHFLYESTTKRKIENNTQKK